MSFRDIVTLMRVSPSDHNQRWLQEALQNAVQLELSTLPPYLCAYWSIADPQSPAATLIYEICMQEMKHMALAANMVVGVGGSPQLVKVPAYPGRLPGGVLPDVKVHLAGLSKPYLKDVCMAIEKPEQPLARGLGETYPTIGAFYNAIIEAFDRLKPEMLIAYSIDNELVRQLEIPYPNIPLITNYKDAIRFVEEIQQEGEGTSQSPDEAPGTDVQAHYYKFGSIYYGKTLVKKGDRWVWEGNEVPYPGEVFPMDTVPDGGWKNVPANVRTLLDDFNKTYSNVLDMLERAWTGGGSSAYGEAVSSMRYLRDPAVALMKIPINPNHVPLKTYGPDFRYVR